MDEKLEELQDWGCDIKGAMPRFLDDEEFMLDCIRRTADDPGFDELGGFLRDKNAAGGFDCAHMLKGVTANTGLTPLYEPLTALVEPLRRGRADGLEDGYAELMKKLGQLRAILAG